MFKAKVDKYLILTLIAPILYCCYFLAQGKFLLKGNSDAISLNIPYFVAVNDAVSTDIIPSWTRLTFTGFPLIGSPTLLWYPPNWLVFIVDKAYIPHAMTALAWLHFIGIAFVGYIFFREISKSNFWASVSSLAYTFSLPVMYGLSVVTLSYLVGYLFVPLALYVIHTSGRRARRLNLVYIALITFAIITGAFIQLALYSIPIIFLYSIVIGIFGTETNAGDKKSILCSIGGIIIGILLSAPMLLPMFAINSDTSRNYMQDEIQKQIQDKKEIIAAAGLNSKQRYELSKKQFKTKSNYEQVYEQLIKNTPAMLWRLFSPNAFGHDINFHYRNTGGYNYVESMVSFCGIIILFLAGYAITVKRSPIVIFWTAIFIGIILITVTPLAYIHIFLFGGKTIYNRLYLLLPLAITSLAAIAGQYIDSKNEISLKNVIKNPFWILLVVAAIYDVPVEENYFKVEIARGVLFIYALIVGGLYLCKKSKFLWHLVILCLVLIEGLWSGHLMTTVQTYPLMVEPKHYYTYGSPKNHLPLEKSELQQYRVILGGVENDMPDASDRVTAKVNQGIFYDYMSPWGYSNAFSSRLALLLNKLTGKSAFNPNMGRTVFFSAKPPDDRIADITSVGYVIDFDSSGKKWHIVEDRRATCLPRASLFYEYETFLEDEDFPPFGQSPRGISGLVGYWKFDGNVEDSSGNNNHGGWVGGETYSSDGVSGEAAVFDGTGNYVTVPHSPSINVGAGAFSFGAWVNSYGHIGKNQHFLNKRTGGHQGLFWDLYLSSTDGYINTEIAGHSFGNPPSNMELHKWHHVMLTRDGSGRTTVYIDGKPIKSKTMPGDSSNTHTFGIGNLQGSLDQGFSGLIDEVVIYNRSLSSKEVRMISGRNANREELAAERLKEPDFPIKRKVVLTSDVNMPLGPPDPDSSVEFIENGNSHIVINVITKTPAILLLTDNFAKGWSAQVDGQEAEIMEGNIAFRAVYVPSGEHKVEFHYWPPMLTLSLIIFLFGISGCIFLFKTRNK